MIGAMDSPGRQGGAVIRMLRYFDSQWWMTGLI